MKVHEIFYETMEKLYEHCKKVTVIIHARRSVK